MTSSIRVGARHDAPEQSSFRVGARHDSPELKRVFQAGEWLIVLLAIAIPTSTALTTIVVGGILLCWLFSGNIKEKIQMGFQHTLVRGFLVFFLAYCLALFYTIAPIQEVMHSLRHVGRWWLLFFFLPFCQNKKMTQYALWAFVTTMGLVWLLGLLKVLGFLSIGAKFSAVAVFKNHIVTSYLMSFAAYILAERAYYHKEYREISILFLSVMIFEVLFMSAGRTGYVMLLLLSGFFTWQHWRWRGLLAMLPIVAALLGLGIQYSNTFSERFFHIPGEWQSHQLGAETSMGLRMEFLKTSFYTALEHPWFGTGTGSFATAYAATASTLELASIQNPHNEYLHIWIELGILGCLLLVFLFHRMWQCSRLLTVQERMIAQGFILSFAVGCFGNSILMDFTERHFFILMTALLFSTIPSPYRNKPIKPRAIEEKKCHTFH